MKIDSARFLTSAQDLASCPVTTIPEVAFIGRSNVGKSSLVNLLTKQKELAKVSAQPGKTRLINFYTINGAWNLVDLPGYGFAKVGKGEQDRFSETVSAYLMGRSNLKLVMALIDSRFEPMEIDLQFLAWAQELPAPHAIVFTKRDEVSREKGQRHVEVYTETLQALGLAVPPMIGCSAKERAGRGELIQFIEKTLPKAKKRKPGGGLSLGWMK